MANVHPRCFNDASKSRLVDLYESFSHVETLRPTLSSDQVFPDQSPGSVVKYTLCDLQKKIIDSVEFCREHTKDIVVEPGITGANVSAVSKELLTLPKLQNGSACIHTIKVQHFDTVKFEHSRIAKTGDRRIMPPMFKVSVPACLPNTAQNINTGYILEIPTVVEMREFIDGVITKGARPTAQKPFIIIPQVLCKNQKIIPSLQCRDAEDTGLFTVNIYNRTGEACVLFIYLYAYQVSSARGSLGYENADSTDIRILKSKDTKPNRQVYNLSVKSLFSHGEITQPCLRLKCFDGTKPGHSELLPKIVVFDNVCTFFCSRKREWADPKLMTVSGIFRPNGRSVLPIVSENSEFSINTHCCVFLETRSMLFTVDSPLEPSHLGMNGALFDIANYKELKKARAVLVQDVYTMRTGARMSKRFDSKLYDRDLLMNIYDYGYMLAVHDKFSDTYVHASDHEYLFNNTSDNVKRSITSRIYKNFKMLATRFMAAVPQRGVKRKCLDNVYETDDILCKK